MSDPRRPRDAAARPDEIFSIFAARGDVKASYTAWAHRQGGRSRSRDIPDYDALAARTISQARRAA